MNQRTRNLLLIWGSTIALILLIAALPNLTLAERRYSVSTNDLDALGILYNNLLPIVTLAVPLMIVALILMLPVFRTRNAILALLLLLLIIVLFMWLAAQGAAPELVLTPEPIATGPVTPAATPLPGEIATPLPYDVAAPTPDTPPWLSYFISLIAVTLLLAIVGFLGWRFWPDSAESTATATEEVAQGAETALAALERGDPLRDVILRCYQEMTWALSEARDVRRDSAMTPREFEHKLTKLGLPADAIHNLTQLFEGARYGNVAYSEREQQSAIASLNAIVVALRPQPAETAA
jgi:hypothetical protein